MPQEVFAHGNVDGLALELTPDYNVAPQTMQPVIVWDEGFGIASVRCHSETRRHRRANPTPSPSAILPESRN
jgi:hypothetical protein